MRDIEIDGVVDAYHGDDLPTDVRLDAFARALASIDAEIAALEAQPDDARDAEARVRMRKLRSKRALLARAVAGHAPG